jgi:metacaspase-1
MKIALLMGLNYKGTSSELSGCINDIENTSKILTSVFNYQPENIVCMTDNTQLKPTANNICSQLINIAKRTYDDPIKEVWISYSGHGSYIKDESGDEDDGQDECLVPLDYSESGLISDDTLNHLLGLMKPGVKVVFIIDACHSETMLDLQYRYISGKKSEIENTNSKAKCNCIMISGCKDDQTSSDAYDINNSKEYSGAMTTALLTVLKKFDYTITCWRLLKEMRRFLKVRKFSQIPQISCTRKLSCATLFSCINPNSFLTNEIN